MHVTGGLALITTSAAPRIGPLILGSTGRIGQAMARVWDQTPWPEGQTGLWHHRPGRTAPRQPSLAWDMLHADPPPLPPGLTGIIVLTGGTGSDIAALEDGAALALRAFALAASYGVRVLIASSQAVYGRQNGPVSEDTPCHPEGAYAKAKSIMEQEVAGREGVTCLRIGNVAGCDTLLLTAARGPVVLDRFASGAVPLRSYIGPLTLARVLRDLLSHPGPLPAVLNVAQPGVLGMDTLLKAAGQPFTHRPAPPDALARLELDTSQLGALVSLPPAHAGELIAEARAAGWRGHADPAA